jgi:hypothetical protein
MAERRLDLFKLLGEISKKNITYYETLSEQEVKEFIPFVVQRWLSGTTNKQQIYLLNEIVNQCIFNLGNQHKKLLFDLLTIACSGRSQKYYWNKLPTKTVNSKPVSLDVICQYYNYSKKQGTEALALMSYDDVVYCAEELGKQEEDINKISKEWGVKNVRKNNSKDEGQANNIHKTSKGKFGDAFED